jgi:hypothetical protein
MIGQTSGQATPVPRARGSPPPSFDGGGSVVTTPGPAVALEASFRVRTLAADYKAPPPSDDSEDSDEDGDDDGDEANSFFGNDDEGGRTEEDGAVTNEGSSGSDGDSEYSDDGHDPQSGTKKRRKGRAPRAARVLIKKEDKKTGKHRKGVDARRTRPDLERQTAFLKVYDKMRDAAHLMNMRASKRLLANAADEARESYMNAWRWLRRRHEIEAITNVRPEAERNKGGRGKKKEGRGQHRIAKDKRSRVGKYPTAEGWVMVQFKDWRSRGIRVRSKQMRQHMIRMVRLHEPDKAAVAAAKLRVTEATAKMGAAAAAQDGDLRKAAQQELEVLLLTLPLFGHHNTFTLFNCVQDAEEALEEAELMGFKASAGWFKRFMKRHHLSWRRRNNIKNKSVAELVPSWLAHINKLRKLRTQNPDDMDPDAGLLGALDALEKNLGSVYGKYGLLRTFSLDQVPLPFASDDPITLEYIGTRRVWIKQLGSGLEKRQCTLQLCIRPIGKQCEPCLLFRGAASFKPKKDGDKSQLQKARESEEAEYDPDVFVVWQKKAWADLAASLVWVQDFFSNWVQSNIGSVEALLICDNLSSQVIQRSHPHQ